MAKPIQESIFKSRLTIAYRTTITGTLTQERLPYRLLVLGNFTGNRVRDDALLPDIEARRVCSIKRGMTVDHFITEMIPTAAVPESLPELKAKIGGKFSATLRGSISKSDLAEDKTLTFKLKNGDGEFTSSIDDNGATDIKGKVVVGGSLTVSIAARKVEAVEAKLHVAGVVMGTLADPVTGKTVGLVTGHISTQVTVPKEAIVITADEEAEVSGSGRALRISIKDVTVMAERTIPITSLSSFGPDSVATSIPEIRRLLVIKRLLLELQANLRNLPELRKAFKDALPGLDDSPEQAKSELALFDYLKTWALEQYPLLKIDKAAPAAQPSPAAQPEPSPQPAAQPTTP